MEDLLAIFCIFGLPVGALIVFRVLKHRERMEMIRQGMVPQGRSATWTVPPPPPAPGFAPQGGRGRRGRCDDGQDDPPHVTLRKGIGLAMIGLALTIGLSFIGLDDGTFHPGPWLLGGLIPMFVGVGQIIVALLSGASFGPARQWPAGPPPPNPGMGASSPGPARQVYDTSYTYRPGDTTELLPPASPPDRR